MSQRSTDIRWHALVATALLMLYLCWEMLRPFLQVVVWSALVAILFYPAHRFILALVKRPGLAAALSLLLVVVVVIAPIAFVTTAMVTEVAQMASRVQTTLQALRNDPDAAQKLQAVVDAAKQYVDVDQVVNPEKLAPYAQQASQFLLSKSAGFVGGLVGGIISLAFTLFTLFYLFRDGERIREGFPAILPLDRARSEALLERTRSTITACVYGVVVIAIIQGTLGGVMFAILGLPSALMWGVVMTILATIPMAGTAVIWAPAAAILVVAGSYTKAAVLFAWGLLVIGTVDNFLRPRLVSERANMHPLFIFFSVLGGLSAFGIVGVLIGPVVLAITIALLEVVFADAQTAAPASAGAPPDATARPAGRTGS